MAIRFYQLGDYDNTILRKILENQAAIIAGTETMATTGGGGGGVSAWGDITGTLSDQSDLQSALDGKATAGVVSTLSSNALVLAEEKWPVKTVTWSTAQELTFTGGTNSAGDGVEIFANVTTEMVLTVTFTSSTVYRNGAVSALASTVTFPVGKHRIVFWTPDDGTTVYMEDTVFSAEDVPVAATPTNYTAASADVEAHLAGIDTALASAGGGSMIYAGGSTTAVISNSAAETSVSSFTIPGGTLGDGTSKAVRVAYHGLLLNNSGSARDFGLRIKYGSETLFDDFTSGSTVTSSATGRLVEIDLWLCGDGTTGTQRMWGVIRVGGALSATSGYGDLAANGLIISRTFAGTSSQDSTADKTFNMTVELTAASSSFTWTSYRTVASVVQ